MYVCMYVCMYVLILIKRCLFVCSIVLALYICFCYLLICCYLLFLLFIVVDIYIHTCMHNYVYPCILHQSLKGLYFYESLCRLLNFPIDEYKRRGNTLLQLCNSWKEKRYKRFPISSVGRAYDCKYAWTCIHR